MFVKEVRIRRNVNLGNFEGLHAEAAIELEKGDDPHSAFAEAKRLVAAALTKKGGEAPRMELTPEEVEQRTTAVRTRSGRAVK